MFLVVLLMFASLARTTFAVPTTITLPLVMSFDASDIDGNDNSTMTDGQTLTGWVDASGNGRNLTSVTGTPIYVESFTQATAYHTTASVVSLNSTPTAREYLTGSGSNALTDYPVTVFVVCTGPDQNNGNNFTGSTAAFSCGNSAATDRFFFAGVRDTAQTVTGSPITAVGYRRQGGDNYTYGTSNINDGDLHLITVRYISATNCQVRVDGVWEGTGTGNLLFPNATDIWRIGQTADSSPTGAEFTGEIGEVLVYDGDVTGADLATVEGYLQAKWIGSFPFGSGSVSFVSQVSGQTYSAVSTATLSNTGNTTLTITAMSPDKGSFATDTLTIESLTYPIEVAPGGSVEFDVTWLPAGAAGERDAFIDVTSDNPTTLTLAVNAELLPATLQGGLTTYYDFEETSGNSLEDRAPEGTRNDASVVGVGLTTSSVTGYIGRGYNGPDDAVDYISIDTVVNDTMETSAVADMLFGDAATGTDFSISVWTRQLQSATAAGRSLGNIDFGQSWPNRSGVGILSDGNDTVRFRIHVLNEGVDNSGTPWDMTDLEWYHMVVTMDRDGAAGGYGLMKTYINGVFDKQEVIEGTGVIGLDTLPYLIGRGIANSANNADFDEFGVWNRDLHADEIQQIYASNVAGDALLDIVDPVAPTISFVDDREPYYLIDVPGVNTIIVTVSNDGIVPLVIEPNQTFTGSDAGEFAFGGAYDETTTHTVLPGDTLDVPVEYTWALPEGTKDAFLSFDYNNGMQSNYALDVVLSHLEPGINMSDDASNPYYRDDSTTFSVTVTVTNDSTGLANIGPRSLSSPDASQFAFANDESSTVSLPSTDPDSTYDIDVVWTWSGTDDYSTSFTVSFDDNVLPDYVTSYTVELTLSRRDADISVTDDAEGIYYIDEPSPYSFNVTVSNSSLGTLVIQPQSFAGPAATELNFGGSYDESIVRNIGPSQSLVIPVEWTPSALGATTATLSFDHNVVAAGLHTDYLLELDQQSRDSQYLTLQNDLVIYYHFDETSGNVISDYGLAGDDNDASVIGRAMDAATTEGIVGAAYHSPIGTTDFAAIDTTPDNAYTTTGIVPDLMFGDQASGTDFSISCWIKPIGFDSSDGNVDSRWLINVDFTIANNTPGRSGVALMYHGGVNHSIWRFHTSTTANREFQFNPPSYIGAWSMMTTTVDRDGGANGTGQAHIYVNGALVGSLDFDATMTGAIDGNIAMLIGTCLIAGDSSDTVYDEFAVWHRVLESSEIQYIYRAGLRGYEFTDPASYVPPKVDPSSVKTIWEMIE